jgi:hypothetical protein
MAVRDPDVVRAQEHISPHILKFSTIQFTNWDELALLAVRSFVVSSPRTEERTEASIFFFNPRVSSPPPPLSLSLLFLGTPRGRRLRYFPRDFPRSNSRTTPAEICRSADISRREYIARSSRGIFYEDSGGSRKAPWRFRRESPARLRNRGSARGSGTLAISGRSSGVRQIEIEKHSLCSSL